MTVILSNIMWTSLILAKQKIKLFWIQEKTVFDKPLSCTLDIIEMLEQLEDLVAIVEPLRPHASTNEWKLPVVDEKPERLRYLKMV